MSSSASPAQPSLSIVTVSYESGAALARTLPIMRAVAPDAELIVVDNASAVDPPDEALLRRVGAALIRRERNLGFGRACNGGAQAARGRYVALVNPDVELLSLPQNLDGLRMGGDGFGIVAPAPADRSSPTVGTFRESRPLFDALAFLLAPYWPRRWPRPPWAFRRGDDWASGAAIIVDREEFLGLGGFDERLFFLYEDRELSRRYRERGLPVRESAAFRCRHELGGSVAHEAEGQDQEARRRFLAALGLIEYWWLTQGSARATLRGTGLILALRGLAWVARIAALLAPRSRWAEKARMEAQVRGWLQDAHDVNGSLVEACAIARRASMTLGRREGRP